MVKNDGDWNSTCPFRVAAAQCKKICPECMKKYMKNGLKNPLDPNIKSKTCKGSLETGQLGCSGKSSVYLYLPPIKIKYH